MSNSSPAQSEALALAVARPVVRISLMSIILLVAAVVADVRGGPDADAMVIGAIAAVFGANWYSRLLTGGKGYPAAALLPYLFGVYVLFYEGLWGGRTLFSHFSLTGVLWHAVLVFWGYRIVFWTWRLTEMAEALRAGRPIGEGDPTLASLR